MENERKIEAIGKIIFERRKAKGFTQKDLARQLGITDKAISKWERGLSCPDISLLIPLSKLLEVSTGELLSGEQNLSETQVLTKQIVDETIRYSSKLTAYKIEKIKQGIFFGLSVVFLLTIMICFICDYFIGSGLSWSFIVALSVVAGWLLLIPFVRSKGKAVRNAFITLSVLIIPYLAGLSLILDMPTVLALGKYISIVSMLGLWAVYAVFVKFQNRKWCAWGIIFLILIPISLVINHVSAYFVASVAVDRASDIVNSIITLGLAVICFGIDYIQDHIKRKNHIGE